MRFENTIDFEALNAAVDTALPRGISAGLEHIRSVAVSMAPEDTGDLKRSAGTTVIDLMGAVYFTSVYARYQHYGIFYRHGRFGPPLTYHRGGGPFFLQTPMISEADFALELVANAVRTAL